MTHARGEDAAAVSVFVCTIADPGRTDHSGLRGDLSRAVEMLESSGRPVQSEPPASCSAPLPRILLARTELSATLHLREALQLLSGEETARAARLIQPGHRLRYVLAHATLRLLLGRRLAIRPAEVAFSASPSGKPLLARQPEELAFNISYGDWAFALAVSRDAVGVDIEATRKNLPFSQIGRRFFQPEETAFLESGPDRLRRDRFFRLWTRKEAVLKTLGVGLSGLGSLSVLRDSLDANDEHGCKTRVAVRTIPGPPGHVLAVASRQNAASVAG